MVWIFSIKKFNSHLFLQVFLIDSTTTNKNNATILKLSDLSHFWGGFVKETKENMADGKFTSGHKEGYLLVSSFL